MGTINVIANKKWDQKVVSGFPACCHALKNQSINRNSGTTNQKFLTLVNHEHSPAKYQA